ncbi:hypothetical protein GlitD10_0251 [Gloeomargarita lithophora Alchichica-D10]|uniref:DUF1800 domain-containing protein n=1 Tax=Gloeomargarita lithophora Alchichica-D10 TaxID=1188229 RepID=A0A1J0A9D3_9CYAN|nr:DUF1800 domain-containing protein [Gloeomargarita lithophora]APB32552.1 hypothetical protein GlitD10_0251 [Gloeomargarita lithophora Alchichica-D10]
MDGWMRRAHLWRRVALGGTWEELNRTTSEAELVSRWLGQITMPNLPNFGERNRQATNQQRRQFGQWLINQWLSNSNPLQERLVNFWRDHFVVSIRKIRFPQLLVDYEQRLRRYAWGDFQELLWQVSTSPAMLAYLDNNRNRMNRINENFSRELLELFTIGRGNYTEIDIQEGARALTGWIVVPNFMEGRPLSTFMPRRHDAGLKNYLGKKGNFKTEDVVEMLANHPGTARTLATKLWSTLVYPEPEPEIVQRLAKVYTQNRRQIRPMVEAIFTSPEFYSPKAYRSYLKSPLFFLLGSLRQLQISPSPERLLAPLRAMGQIPYNAPTVKGWPDSWLTAPALLTRLSLAQQLTRSYSDDLGFDFQPGNYSTQDLLRLLLDGNPDRGITGALSGLNTRETAALLLASPAYQLA